MEKTIIYYTSNREDKKFEKIIMQELVKQAGDIPIISVSQKPIELGKNICVGEIGFSDLHIYRQLLRGCEEADTPFVVMAESDCLYPPEYFLFSPPDENKCYRYDNLYIFHKWKDGFFQKRCSQCAQIVGRKHIIERLKYCIENNKTGELFEKWEYYHSENPVINIKTADGLRKRTHMNKQSFKNELPFWGSCEQVKKRLWQ